MRKKTNWRRVAQSYKAASEHDANALQDKIRLNQSLMVKINEQNREIGKLKEDLLRNEKIIKNRDHMVTFFRDIIAALIGRPR